MQLERLVVGVFVLLCLYQLGQVIVRWIRNLPVPPDPWEARLSVRQPDPPVPPNHSTGDPAMRLLLRAKDLSGIDVHLLKGLLEQAAIPCLIKNESLAIAIGDLPPAECFQELWLLDAADYSRAKAIYESWQTATPPPTATDAGTGV